MTQLSLGLKWLAGIIITDSQETQRTVSIRLIKVIYPDIGNKIDMGHNSKAPDLAKSNRNNLEHIVEKMIYPNLRTRLDETTKTAIFMNIPPDMRLFIK